MRNTLNAFEREIMQIVQDRLEQCSYTLFQQLAAVQKYQIESNPFYLFIYPQINVKNLILSQTHGVICDIHIFRKEMPPIQALVHVEMGAIHMIEIFCADSSALPDYLDYNKIETEYFV